MFILHIDGDALLRKVLKRALRLSRHPIQLQQFARGDEALRDIDCYLHDVDVVFMSVELPGRTTGLEVARTLRSRGYAGAILLTSARHAPDADWLGAYEIEFLSQPGHIRNFVMKLPSYSQRLLEASAHG